MTNQVFNIKNVPEEVSKYETSLFLTRTDLAGAMQSGNKFMHSLFKDEFRLQCFFKQIEAGNVKKAGMLMALFPNILKSNVNQQRIVDQLLSYIVEGNQKAVETLIGTLPSLLCKRGNVKDDCGRYFQNVAPLELVTWTMDVRYMANAMLDCLPNDTQGENIRKILALQLEQLKKNGGVTYQLNGISITEYHFNVQPLFAALQFYEKNASRWDDKGCENYWIHTIGRLQKLLPTYFRQHYCDPKQKFVPTPSFDNETFTRQLTFINTVSNSYQMEPWDKSCTELGEKFAIYRSELDCAAAMIKVTPEVAGSNYTALAELHRVRKLDGLTLANRINTPLQISLDATATPIHR